MRNGIPDRLRELRKRKGWTQHDTAYEVGVDLRTYQRWEEGEHEPSLASLRALADAFDADAQVIRFGQELEPLPTLERRIEKLEKQVAGLLRNRRS